MEGLNLTQPRPGSRRFRRLGWGCRIALLESANILQAFSTTSRQWQGLILSRRPEGRITGTTTESGDHTSDIRGGLVDYRLSTTVPQESKLLCFPCGAFPADAQGTLWCPGGHIWKLDSQRPSQFWKRRDFMPS
ncbi:hypothetical protein MPTK2_1g11410 [Marchantia polymorpha subsp. ruderalis]